MAAMKYSARRKARVMKKYGAKRRRIGSSGTVFSARWPRIEAGLPDTTLVKLRYADTFTLTSLLGATTSKAFRMNSIFDPDYTGAGHQPLYHDAWQALYNRYTVVKSTIKATINSTDTTAGADFLVGIAQDDDGTISTTATTNVEGSNCVSALLTPSGGARDTITLYGSVYTPKARLGLTNNDDTVGATFGGNPGISWFSSVWASQLNGAASSSVRVLVVVEFLVKMNRLSTQTQS